MKDWPNREGYWWAIYEDGTTVLTAAVSNGGGYYLTNSAFFGELKLKEKATFIWHGPLVEKTLNWPNDKGHWGLIPIETVEDGLTPIHDTVTYNPDQDYITVKVSAKHQHDSADCECQIWGVDFYSRAEFEKKFGKYKFYQINRYC